MSEEDLLVEIDRLSNLLDKAKDLLRSVFHEGASDYDIEIETYFLDDLEEDLL